jgi:hypothetical protein
MNDRSVNLPEHVSDFLIQHCLPGTQGNVIPGFTEYHDTETNQKYRAHPSYLGEPWYDMIMVNWHGEENLIPAQVYTFVDLTHLRQGHRVTAEGTGQAGHRRIATGRYAVVESYTVMNDIDDGDPESLIPPVDALSMVGRFKKEYAKDALTPTLYLVNVTAISGPAVGIPNQKPDSAVRLHGTENGILS